MNDLVDVRILLLSDAEALGRFARERITIKDPMEAEMASWNARWRPEALAHYLPQGWSFGAFGADGAMKGFILGQPLLFYRGLTQTLWIEDLGHDDVATARALLDVVYRWSRDKHLQCVLLEAKPDLQFIVHEWKNVHRIEDGLIELRTSKY
jgi:hypothetical protein